MLERRAFLQLLWDCLSDTDKSHVRFNAKVIDIEERVDDIQVKLADGTVERGDIVLGCDGVHSLVRELMWKNANTSQPGFITAREKTCKVSFQLFCLLSILNDLRSHIDPLDGPYRSGPSCPRDGQPYNDMRPQ